MTNKRKLVLGLVLVAAVVLGFFLYSYVARPAFDDYTTKIRDQGVAMTVDALMNLTSSPECNVVPLILGDRIVNIVAVECLA